MAAITALEAKRAGVDTKERKNFFIANLLIAIRQERSLGQPESNTIEHYIRSSWGRGEMTHAPTAQRSLPQTGLSWQVWVRGVPRKAWDTIYQNRLDSLAGANLRPEDSNMLSPCQDVW